MVTLLAPESKTLSMKSDARFACGHLDLDFRIGGLDCCIAGGT